MTETAAPADFHLVPIREDGSPAQTGLTLPSGLAEMLEGTRALYAATGFAPPWISYLSVATGRVVGGGAFVGATRDGAAEIAYFTLPEARGLGHAGRTAAALIRIARAAAGRIPR
ncbi:hypothetical protein [Rhodobacter calidifons]|uniref:Acetyltransferase (GNAT) family protein n=1 Tax=Rhodobacter calidifons TaxID=2715277 RepID=A0ABX0G8H1_9RHOB|nr:hypothetical protein [Rhodobacter calidifons]NHB77516.1 hypothetical protein [Rhodobacter calidifons]